ncbi:MAG: 30S ribosomal protein S6e [Methanoregulaceae archaeon]|nr:30S ribosomal protein S6e [Methanoregulaceae archaeon]
MVDFKVVLSDPRTGRAYNVDVSGGAAGALVGRHIGEEVDAGALGLSGYRIQITGGSDRNGTPAKKNLPMSGRRKLLLSGGVGFKPVVDGERRRKAIRGNEITTDFVQINAQVVSYGDKPLEEQFAKPAPAEKAA